MFGATVTDWQQLRQDLWFRQAGRCGVCGRDLAGDGAAHHRRARSQGGTHTLDNLILLHTACHRQVHANPLWARGHGMIVPSWADPADRPPVTCDDPTCKEHAYEA